MKKRLSQVDWGEFFWYRWPHISNHFRVTMMTDQEQEYPYMYGVVIMSNGESTSITKSSIEYEVEMVDIVIPEPIEVPNEPDC